MSDSTGRPPRWDTDDRGIGIGDARSHLEALDALRLAADEPGWITEEPEAHLLPHLLRHVAGGSSWVIEATATKPDGVLEVDARWLGPVGAGRRAIRAAAYGLIGAVAEATTLTQECHGSGGITFDIVTGVLGATEFASHGHTLRLRVAGPITDDQTVGTVD